MTSQQIMLYTVTQTQKFVAITERSPVKVTVVYDDIEANGSSLVSMLNIPFCKPSTIMVNGVPEKVNAYLESIKEFVYKGGVTVDTA